MSVEKQDQKRNTKPGPSKPGRHLFDVGHKNRLQSLRRTLRALPAWFLSLIVHLLTLAILTLATFATAPVETKRSAFDASPFDTKVAPEEVVQMLTDPSDDPTRTLAAAANSGDLATQDAPSATPVLTDTGKYMRPEDLMVDVVIPKVSVEFASPVASKVMTGQSGFKGDVIPASEVGEALDQIAREILVQLGRNRVIVAWLFDESESMRDDQKAILDRFDRIMSELDLRVDETTGRRAETEAANDVAEADPKKRSTRRKERVEAEPLRHAVIGFGDQFDLMLDPSSDRKKVAAAVNQLRTDTSGNENTFGAIALTLQRYGSLVDQEQRLIIVLVTDESADDLNNSEEVISACKRLRVPVFVIGRQAMFGTDRLQYRWVDPQTKDVYWTTIRRGPESAAAEALQWDGLHPRRDDQPSGFAPYDLARLTKETGGRFFLLPTAENERVRQREKAYNFNDIRELSPDYEGRSVYLTRRNNSRLRSTMAQIIQQTNGFGLREEFPVNPPETLESLIQAGNQAKQRLVAVTGMEKLLRGLQRDRDRDPERRWQANYDLMLAQLVYSEVKLMEYIALMDGWIRQIQAGKPPLPQNKPAPDRVVSWVIGHSRQRQAPEAMTAERTAEAEKLLNEVINRYPNTPWSDLSKDLLSRGLSVTRGEYARSILFQERAKLVPKF
ncbi:MAG: hypothetical protein RJA81_2141 [Planctomycetota bacterium]